MQLVRFEAEHLPAYQSWFSDPALQAFLGPAPNREWLDHILRETDGRQYAALVEGNLVAVAGLLLPRARHPCWVLTDLAVRPDRRGMGLGSRVWQEILRLHPPDAGQCWLGFLQPENRAARSFMIRNGWHCATPRPDAEGMLRFEYIPAAP